MSEPVNPLSKFSTYQLRHILGVYTNGLTAESHELKSDSGEIGDSIPDGVIVVNEFVNDRFVIPTVVWEWSKFGIYGPSTTSMSGMLEIADHTGGQFVDWFRTNAVKKFGMSAQQLTFALKTYFIGVDRLSNTPDVITGNPLIFHVHNFSDIMNSTEVGTRIKMIFTAAYNTSALTPTLSKPYHITLTHKDGGLNNSSPEPANGKGSMVSRKDEDAAYGPKRKERLDKSKPMRTLKDAFDALEYDLTQQNQSHKIQVQTWLGEIRNKFVQKIKIPSQERGDKLPIKFKVKLDPVYNSYEIDNRNLPFEQTEEDPEKNKGVTSIPFRLGASIPEMVETIMKYSIKVGEDTTDQSAPKTFKTNVSYIKTKTNIEVHIKIKQISIPHNTQTAGDTGPGKSPINNPLEFTFKSGQADDVDIISLRTSIQTENGVKVLEKPVTDGTKKPLVVFGNRESITVERITQTAPGTNYFKSEYSGLRLPVIPALNNGLENAAAAALFDASLLVTQDQTSDHEIHIIGNPNLMFDFHRLPTQSSELESPGNALYYKIPESYPIYVKLKLYLKPDSVIGLNRAEELDIPVEHFYKNHYEVSGVITNLTDGKFYQNLILKKTDDII